MARKDTTHLAPSARAHRTGAGLLSLIGLGLFSAGAAFATAPLYSSRLTQFAEQAAHYGLENGTLLLGGLVFFGLALTARASGRPRKQEAQENPLAGELRLLGEQLSAKLAQLRTSMLQISEQVATLSSQHAAQMQHESDRHDSPLGQDGLFRLAASLDKLSAHIDERIHGLDLQVRSGMEALAGQLQHAPAAHRSHGAAHAQPSFEPEFGSHEAAPEAEVSSPFSAAYEQPQEGGIDFYETMQKLDAISGDALQEEPDAPLPNQGDALDALLPEEYRDRY